MKCKIRFSSLLAVAVLTMLMPWAPGRPFEARNDLKDKAAPREITPRGELSGDERATIDLFERSRDSVVFITTNLLCSAPHNRFVVISLTLATASE